MIAWAIGLIPFGIELDDAPTGILLTIGIAAALGLLLSIGVMQWRVLRQHLPRAGWWIATTAAAWTAGLIAFAAVTSPLWREGQAPAVVAAIGVLGGLVMAAAMAAASGAGLAWLIDRQ